MLEIILFIIQIFLILREHMIINVQILIRSIESCLCNPRFSAAHAGAYIPITYSSESECNDAQTRPVVTVTRRFRWKLQI